MSPVTVYLDNADLSRLFKAQTNDVAIIRAELLEMKATGIVVFPFSFWHVVEFIQKPPVEYRAEHRRKAAFLHELCGENALPHYLDILNGRSDISARSIWLPRELVDRLSVDLMGSLREAADGRRDLSRHHRRQLRSTRFSKGYLRKAQNLERFLLGFPISEKFKREQTLTRFVRGEIGKDTFSESIAELFCYPPMFYDQWYQEDERSELLTNISEKIGRNLVDTLDKARSQLPKMHEARKQVLKAKKSYYDLKRKFKAEYGFYPNIDESGLKSAKNFDISDLLSGISMHRRLEYIKHYFEQAIKTEIYKENDAIDLLHLFYTPDVDLMRCDKAMFRLMRNCPDFPSSKLVPSLLELPARISALRN